eukprot:613076-Pleurochrysis_carterae.AAC.1
MLCAARRELATMNTRSPSRSVSIGGGLSTSVRWPSLTASMTARSSACTTRTACAHVIPLNAGGSTAT